VRRVSGDAREQHKIAAYLGMERDPLLTFSPANHPHPKVRRVGFELTDPYVEHCWAAVVGPSSTLLLRRMPVLWAERVPAEIPTTELSRSIGLGRGTGHSSRLTGILRRLEQFKLVRRAGVSDDQFEMFVEVPPLTRGQLVRVPEWTRATHERLFGAHLDGLAGVSERDARIASITARLDRLQQPSGRGAERTTGLGRSIGR
jgi:hypothetical protein